MNTTNPQPNQQTTPPQSTANMQPAANQGADFFDFQTFIRIFLGKWYLFLASVVVCTSLGIIQCWRTPNTFVQQASLLVKDQKNNSTGNLGSAFSDIAGISGMMSNNVVNEMHIIKSRSVMQGVVAHHGFQYHYYEPRFWRLEELYKNSPIRLVPIDVEESYNRATSFQVDFIHADTTKFTYKSADTTFTCPFNKVVDLPRFGLAIVRVNGEAALDYMEHINHHVIVSVMTVEQATGVYLGGLSCTPPDKRNESSVLEMSYASSSPNKAADILNAVIEEYNHRTINSKNEVLDSSLVFIAKRIAVVGAELADLDDQLEAFKRAKKSVNPNSEAANFLTRSTGQEEKIADLVIQERLIRELVSELSKPQEDFAMIPLNVGINNTVLNGQISSYNQEVSKYRQLRSAGSEKSPTVVRMAATLNDMYAVIVSTANDVQRQLSLQLNETQSLANKNLSRVADANSNMRALVSLEREQVVKSELYNYLLQKTEENAILKSMTEPNVRIINSAWGSSGPVSPRKARILLIAFVIGLAIPYVFFIAKEMLYTKVRGRSDITDVVKAPIVGEIPSKPRKQAAQTIFVEAGANNQISESFRILRTNLSFLNVAGDKLQVLAMTSTLAGEGKSYVAANLAMACAISGKKVCLVDIDLRKMSTSRFFKMRGKKGISEYLASGEGKITDFVLESQYENVFILPGGVIPPNPAELLMSERFDTAIAELRKHYDIIILDNPPLDVVADTGIANRAADATLYVVRVGVLDRRQLASIQETYTSGRLHNMAIVVTDVDYDALNYSIGYTGYGKYYGYRYYGHTYYNYYASYNEGETKHKHSYGLYRRHKK